MLTLTLTRRKESEGGFDPEISEALELRRAESESVGAFRQRHLPWRSDNVTWGDVADLVR